MKKINMNLKVEIIKQPKSQGCFFFLMMSLEDT